MRTTLVCAGAAVLFCCATSGQDAAANLKFDNADVRVSKPGTSDGGGYLGDGKVEFRGGTLLDMISQAYNLESERILGGPAWLDRNRFDITAKAAPNASEETLQTMFQALLADRFGLVVHKDTKPMPVYVLTVSKRGLKMKPSAENTAPRFQGSRDGDMLKYELANTKISQVADRMRGMAGGYVDGPVIDRTGLTGGYDFSLSWTARGQLHKIGPDGTPGVDVTFFDALEKQAGLHLEKAQEPLAVIVIDAVNEKPTENPNSVTKAAPAEPTEFEVATLKPTAPDVKQQNFRRTPSGQLDIQNLRVRDFVMFAYDIEAEMLVGAPKWMEDDRYDLTAKTVPSASDSALQVMVKNLLAERFKLKVHNEEQPVPVFAMTVAKASKMKPSDGTARAGCKNGLLDGMRALTCQNTTMEELAAKLRGAAPAYFDHNVVNLTELKGAFDFELKWAPRGRVDPAAVGRGGGDQPAPPVASSGASDPNGDLTVFEALEKQLGLKIVRQKHPMQVLVIDHIERQPTDN